MEVENRDQFLRRHATVVHTYIPMPRWEVENWDQSETWNLRNGISHST
jgi:hypothetical protein